jgi:DNA-binding GntR family transcriptional regulator
MAGKRQEARSADADEQEEVIALEGSQSRSASKRRRGVRSKDGGSILDRHLSPALQALSASKLHIAPLTSTRARIYASLWRPIAEGRLRPGMLINESVLEQTFRVSRSVVRPVLEHMEMEGYLVSSARRGIRVATPSPEVARAVFEALSAVMIHVVRELAAPHAVLVVRQQKLIEHHMKVQADADVANELIDAHLLGLEFLVLLAAVHGNVIFTDLVSRLVVLHTLILKLYGEFPPPPWHVAFQNALVGAILANRPDEAETVFRGRHAALFATLRFSEDTSYEEQDLATVLTARLS